MGHWLGRNIPNQGARMTQQSINGGMDRLLTPLDAAAFLCVSLSWLAKARMRGHRPRHSLSGECTASVDEIADAFVDQRTVGI